MSAFVGKFIIIDETFHVVERVKACTALEIY